MPYTAYTMLVGCLAIAGAPIIPFYYGFSGYHSKDSIIEQALAFRNANPQNPWSLVLLVTACLGAAITAFYMFRLWYMTFSGEPRDHHIYDHAHESPKVMYVPLVILAVFATAVGWDEFGVVKLLNQSRPAGLMARQTGEFMTGLTYPGAHEYHSYGTMATIIALCVATSGFVLATLFYGTQTFSAEKAKSALLPLYVLFRHKWYFDELYDFMFVRPVMFIARRISDFDRRYIDGLISGLARAVRLFSGIDDLIDRYLVDGLVNIVAGWTHSFGLALRGAQTGRLRQYVMFIVVGTVGLFVLISFFLKSTLAGQ
jgi:NADH-quinone oxidoreductase subunit L